MPEENVNDCITDSMRDRWRRPSHPDPAPWLERLVASAPPGVERLPAAVLARMIGIHFIVGWLRANAGDTCGCRRSSG